jgi:two-component system, NtrC family, response regulator AtoC
MSLDKIRILLIEDEEFDVRRIQNTIKPFENRVMIKEVVADGNDAIELLQINSKKFDVVIMDFQISGSLMGEQLIKKIKRIDPTLQIIVVTKMTINMTDFNFANSLLEAGAMWYCTKYPGDIEEYIYQPTDFILNIFNAYEKRKLEKERVRSNRKLQKTIDDLLKKKKIIGSSPVLIKLKEQINHCAEINGPVLIQGSSGTGKELVASHIHYLSKRKFENFVPINCGSLPESLIESELFGFEKGSFTGATSTKPGLFEVANNGTIFLDEVSELPLPAQATLLRVLQEGEIDKIGRTKKVNVDVRIISATNRDLRKEVAENRFREDLFYRLNVFTIYVPLLKERLEDIIPLTEHFLEFFSKNMDRFKPTFEEEALDYLSHYDWPGNIRQLQNVVQRILFINENRITKDHITFALGLKSKEIDGRSKDFLDWFDKENIIPLREIERKFRTKYFEFVQEITKSDAEAARMLGLAPPNYYRMCKELGLK